MKLKIVDLNLWIGGQLMVEVIDFLHDQSADIICLQEVFDGHESHLPDQFRSIDVLKTKLDYPYFHFAPAFIEDVAGENIVQGNLVLSRLPLSHVNTSFYSFPFAKRINDREHFHQTPRNLQHVCVNIDSKTIHLFNTQGVWGEDGGDNQPRIQMAKKIVQEIDGLENVILTGDFNVQPNTKSIQLIESLLKNVFKDELKTSFNLQRKDLKKYPGFAEAVVDMFFVSPNIKVLSHSCPQVDISDHLPLVAEIEI